MSIATEIQRLKQAKVDIKTAIEEKGVAVGDGSIDTYAQKIKEISTSGGGALPLSSAKIVQFASLNGFGQRQVILNLEGCTSLANFCNVSTAPNRNVTVEHLTINASQPTGMNSCVQCSYAQRDLTLKRLTLNLDTSKAINWLNAFSCLCALEVIDGTPLELTSATNVNNIFNYCEALREVRFASDSIRISINLSHSAALSDESIESVVQGLADLSGATAQTLTLHQTVKAKLTDAQNATITAKNWQLA